MKKGFTLIEILIVITIIGILAVIFIPNLLEAPAKGRDSARQADVTSIVKAIEAARVDGKVEFTALNNADTITQVDQGCADVVLKEVRKYFPGSITPSDPNMGAGAGPSAGTCNTNYYIMLNPDGAATYKYAVLAKVEIEDNATVHCTPTASWIAPGVDAETWCIGTRVK